MVRTIDRLSAGRSRVGLDERGLVLLLGTRGVRRGLSEPDRRREQLVFGAERNHEVAVLELEARGWIDANPAVQLADSEHLRRVGRQKARLLERLAGGLRRGGHDHLLDTDAGLPV